MRFVVDCVSTLAHLGLVKEEHVGETSSRLVQDAALADVLLQCEVLWRIDEVLLRFGSRPRGPIWRQPRLIAVLAMVCHTRAAICTSASVSWWDRRHRKFRISRAQEFSGHAVARPLVLGI